MANGIKWELEQAIIDALGLNGQSVTEIVLKLAYDSVPTVTVTMDLHGDNDELVRSIRKFVADFTEVIEPPHPTEARLYDSAYSSRRPLTPDETAEFDQRANRYYEAHS